MIKIGPFNVILKLIKVVKVSIKAQAVKTAPASHTLPLETTPDPSLNKNQGSSEGIWVQKVQNQGSATQLVQL